MGALNFEKNRLNEPIRFAEFNITTNQITVFSVTKIYNKAEKNNTTDYKGALCISYEQVPRGYINVSLSTSYRWRKQQQKQQQQQQQKQESQ